MNWHSNFEYRDGKLFWKIKHCKKVCIGDKVGWISGNGYLAVDYKKKSYKVHRVIWELHNGPIPKGMDIDHINGIRDDNRIENLRLASRSQNLCNSAMRSNNTSGLKGVRWHNQRQKWNARIVLHGREKSLGLFPTKEEAYAARLEAEKLYHGEFAASEERKLVVA